MSEDSREAGGPQPVHQVVITLLDNQTTNLSYSCDELLARGLLDKARSMIDVQVAQQMQAAQARIVSPEPGVGFSTNGRGLRGIPGVRDVTL